MEGRFIIIDEYGESLRTFNTRDAAEEFVRLRPKCKIDEPHVMTLEEFSEEFGDPPF